MRSHGEPKYPPPLLLRGQFPNLQTPPLPSLTWCGLYPLPDPPVHDSGSSWCTQVGGMGPQRPPHCLLTCTGCPADSVDVDLREPGGVVVNDHLHCGNVQAPRGRGWSAPLPTW